MSFVRLQGCTVGCPWCDTKYSWSRRRGTDMSAEKIADRIASRGLEWVAVTGGEPTEQDLSPLVAALRVAGKRILLETAGTGHGWEGCRFDWFCLSPKLGIRKPIEGAVLAADELKFVVGREEDIPRIDAFLASFPDLRAVVDLQPLDLDPWATGVCARAAVERGWRLSRQTHRLIGIR